MDLLYSFISDHLFETSIILGSIFVFQYVFYIWSIGNREREKKRIEQERDLLLGQLQEKAEENDKLRKKVYDLHNELEEAALETLTAEERKSYEKEKQKSEKESLINQFIEALKSDSD